MSNHTGTVCACQDHASRSRGETTPAPSSTAPEAIDRRLVQRYGVALLTGGYTALPTYAWVYYARLGVTEAEMVCIAQLCTYWWSTRDPYPGEAALAARMGKSVRTIQGYLRSLEGKGLLHIQTRLSTNGRQSTNAYDLRPFFAAVEGLARLDGLLPIDDAAPATPATPDTDACTDGPCDDTNRAQRDAERESLCADATSVGTENPSTDDGADDPQRGEGLRAGGMKDSSPQVNPIEIEAFDYDSIPPTPANTTQTLPDAAARPLASADPDDQALAAEIAVLSAELGDDAPRSSLGRARNLCRDAGVSAAHFLRLLDEAAVRTRDRQAGIVKRRRDDQTSNGMPYLFAVLADLLHPVPSRVADGGPDADRRRAGPSGRRRSRREGSRREPINSYVAWSDSPARLPIVEEHPVWRAALDELAQVMTSENFNAWLATTRALDQDGEVLRVTVPTLFNKTWLEQKLYGKVAGALHKIDYAALRVERVERVEYVVAAAVYGTGTAKAS
jgi:hypothetical protein